MKIVTWNVNSIRARLARVVEWLASERPHVALLQELKCVGEAFPHDAIGELGYNALVCGQKTYNGVAILSLSPIDELARALPGEDTDEEARYLEAFTAGVRVASVYVPQGQAVGTERFAYKLRFLDRLAAQARAMLASEEAFVIGGDLNVAPNAGDVFDAEALDGEVCFHPDERARFCRLMNLGLIDALAALHPEAGHFSYWDYRAGAWTKDQGLRIDHLLLSPQAADRLGASGVDRRPRGLEGCSDHAPVWCELDIG
ncbi:MAG: exodeoxyribonuclease III [Alphaproteobacteria bacterium]|nr:exodeoxyribonuclease III [Alphaproteobacteria bacterium]